MLKFRISLSIGNNVHKPISNFQETLNKLILNSYIKLYMFYVTVYMQLVYQHLLNVHWSLSICHLVMLALLGNISFSPEHASTFFLAFRHFASIFPSCLSPIILCHSANSYFLPPSSFQSCLACPSITSLCLHSTNTNPH